MRLIETLPRTVTNGLNLSFKPTRNFTSLKNQGITRSFNSKVPLAWLDWINEDLTDLPRDMNESSALDSHFTIVANISLFSMVTYILPKYQICIKVLLFFATCYVLQIDSRFCLLFLPRVFLLNVEFKAAEQNWVPRFSQIDVTKEKEKEKHYEQISSWNFSFVRRRIDLLNDVNWFMGKKTKRNWRVNREPCQT